MKIVWDWSLKSETERVVDASIGISNGFYRLNHFLPLPWSPSCRYLVSGVHLPVLPYATIPSYWSRVARLSNADYPLQIPGSVRTTMQEFIGSLALTAPATDRLAELCVAIMPAVSAWLKQFVPGVSLPTQLTIHPTYFGTTGSFNNLPASHHMVIYLRIDQGIHTLVECFLTSILRQTAIQDLSADWAETEFLVDWLLTKSSLIESSPPSLSWRGTIASTRSRFPASLISESTRFLKSIGAPLNEKHAFSVDDNDLYFGKTLLTNLTAREHAILQKLVVCAPSPVTTDELADILFPNPDKFSLDALAKAIERLRTKFAALGISPSYLATASGTGYYLRN